MDAQHKFAYRQLLFHAMLQFRSYACEVENNAEHAKQVGRGIAAIGKTADFLHNLAAASAHEFVGFDESVFWGDWQSWDQDSLPYKIHKHSRTIFELELSRYGNLSS